MEMKLQNFWSFVTGFSQSFTLSRPSTLWQSPLCNFESALKVEFRAPWWLVTRKLGWAEGNLGGLPRGRCFCSQALVEHLLGAAWKKKAIEAMVLAEQKFTIQAG